MSCMECFSGHVHRGLPTGNITRLHGLDTYVVEPRNGEVKGLIIIIPDAFGWDFVNNRILADHYAEKGRYRVFLPDFMKGRAAPVSALISIQRLGDTSGFWNWVLKPYYFFRTLSGLIPFIIFNRFSRAWPTVESFFAAVREDEGQVNEDGMNLPVAAAGFCWGGKHVVNLAHGREDGKNLIDVGFTGHPSLLDIPAEIEKIKIPVSFAVGERDTLLRMSQVRQIQDILETKPEEQKGVVKVYHGASHGFCVRADHFLKDTEQLASEAEDQAIDWFNRHFQKTLRPKAPES